MHRFKIPLFVVRVCMQKIFFVCACSQKIIYYRQKHSSVLDGFMRAHTTTKPWKIAILLTLAPFYPPGNTKSSQKWLLFVQVVSYKNKIKNDFWRGGCIFWWEKVEGMHPSFFKNSHVASENRPHQKVALMGSGAVLYLVFHWRNCGRAVG